jgi:hypothetical protein
MNLKLLESMAHSHVHNYVIPGLTSSLIGGNGHGMVRMFSQERSHEEPITPHSHRFDFQCFVLEGIVWNRIWTKQTTGDLYQCSVLEHHGMFGDQTQQSILESAKWHYTQTQYKKGEMYEMTHDQIHSIFFGKGAKVLFIEGPNKAPISLVLEPVVDGEVIPTFRVEPWMFRKDSGTASP